MKNNISFYSHDVDSHNHWKFKTLRRKYGWAGEGRFWALNNMVAESANCMLDSSNKNKRKAIAAELELTMPELEEYLNYLQNDCELIQVEEGIICTQRTQDDLMRVTKKRETDRDHKSIKNIELSVTKQEISLPKVAPKNGVEKNELSQEVDNESVTKQQVSVTKEQVSVAKDELSYTEKQQNRIDKNRIDKNRVDNNTLENNTCVEENLLVAADALPKQKKDSGDVIKKQQACIQRRENFKTELRTLGEEFSTDLLNTFYKYWAELNKSKTKMRWEMQQTWETKLRLYKWEQNSYKFKNKNKPDHGNNNTKTSFRTPALKVGRNNTFTK